MGVPQLRSHYLGVQNESRSWIKGVKNLDRIYVVLNGTIRSAERGGAFWVENFIQILKLFE